MLQHLAATSALAALLAAPLVAEQTSAQKLYELGAVGESGQGVHIESAGPHYGPDAA